MNQICQHCFARNFNLCNVITKLLSIVEKPKLILLPKKFLNYKASKAQCWTKNKKHFRAIGNCTVLKLFNSVICTKLKIYILSNFVL
jgi:hypothetical protein